MRKLVLIVLILGYAVAMFCAEEGSVPQIIVEEIEGAKIEVLVPEGAGNPSENSKYVISVYDRKSNAERRRWMIREMGLKSKEIGDIKNLYYVGIDSSLKREKKFKFIKDKILPYLESKYGISGKKENIMIAASGEATYDLFENIISGNVFYGMALLFSPDYFSYDGDFLKKIMNKESIETKIWINCGTKQWSPERREMVKMLSGKGLTYGTDLFLYEGAGEGDNDKSWSNQVTYPIKYFAYGNIGNIQDLSLSLLKREEENGDLYIQINTIAQFDTGIRYSLGSNAQYSITDGEISEEGIVFPSEKKNYRVTVGFGNIKKELTVEDK